MAEDGLTAFAGAPAQALEIGEQLNRSFYFIGRVWLHRYNPH
jgi:hypothetical protein